MNYCFNPAWSEDKIISLLCGEFGGLSSRILAGAMSSTSGDGKSSKEVVDDNDDKRGGKRPSKRKYADFTFESPAWPHNRPSKSHKLVKKAVISIVDNIITATRLESINRDNDSEVSKDSDSEVNTDTDAAANKDNDSEVNTETNAAVITQLEGEDKQGQIETNETVKTDDGL